MTTTSLNSSYIYGYSENISDLLAESLKPIDQAGTSEWSYVNQKINNPKITFLEQRIAALEGGISAMAVKSFYYAKMLVIKNLLKAGENIVTYNSSVLYNKDRFKLNRLGIDVRFSENGQLNTFKSLVDEKTKLIYLETIGSEDLTIPDFQKIIAFAKERELPVLVDNTAGAGGYITKPIKNGAHIVIESTKNWLSSHNDIIGAVIIDGGNYNWKNGKYNQFTNPYQYINPRATKKLVNEEISISLTNYFKQQGNINYNKYEIPKNPLSLIHDIEQLSFIVQKANDNALSFAKWLSKQEIIKEVNYTGLPSHKSYFTAITFFKNGFGHELSFSLKDKSQNEHLINYLLEAEPPLKNKIFLQRHDLIKFSAVGITLEKTKQLFLQAFTHVESESAISI